METKCLKMAKLKSRGSLTATISAIMACLVASIATPDASARNHKHSDNGGTTADSQISMEIFPIKRGYDGAQFIVTKAGYLVSIPGLGVAPDATQIAAYKDAQNNIWYIDRNGVAVKLTNEQVQWGIAQINQQAQTASPPPTVAEQQPSQASSGGTSALATGLAAAGGAFAGAALSNSLYNNNFNGIPYGVPVYHNGGRYYYQNSNGNKIYINNSSNNKSVNQINQWNRQTNWQQIQHNNHPTQLPASGHSGRHANAPTQLPAHGGNLGRSTSTGHATRNIRSAGAPARGAARSGGRRR